MDLWKLTTATRNASGTERIGRRIGKVLRPNDVVLLDGTLGAGKTCLAQGILRGLGVGKDARLTSPTFSLINEHRGRVPLYHMDLYRLVEESELDELGFDEYLQAGGVAIIEWAERFPHRMPENALSIRLVSLGDTEREITLQTRDPALRQALDASLTR